MPLDYNPEVRACYARISSSSKLLNRDIFNYRDFFHDLRHMNSNQTLPSKEGEVNHQFLDSAVGLGLISP